MLIFLYSCSAQDQPNIIIINIDDMGWKDVGFMGSEFYETPNIDQLSHEGMKFINGYASAANCAPSRANLLSGRYPQSHGIYTVGSSERGKSKNRKLIPIENKTTIGGNFKLFPEVLKENGYVTCHAGKWHISDDPLKKGFDVNIGGSHAGHPASYYPPYKNVDIPEDGYLTDAIMHEAIDFVKNAQQPFLLYYAPYAVHTPIQQVDSLANHFQNKPAWKGQDNIAYATMIENVDRNIGDMIQTLKEKGVYKNTFIIFTSDNGGLWGITKQRPLRAGKGSYYEGGIKVPFYFVWDGKIKRNSTNKTLISNLDIYPTLMELVGAKKTQFPDLDGISILDLLLNNKQKKNRTLYWHFPIYLQKFKNDNENRDSLFRTRPGSVIRKGNWKLHYYYEDNDIELYNLQKDISEQKNLYLKNKKKAEELKEDLFKWLKKTKAPIPNQQNPDYQKEE